MEEMARGAEAVIYRDGKELVKDRIKKGYRIPELDTKLRKERTRAEARLLTEARSSGVNTPKVLEVSETQVRMELIEGEKLRDILDSRPELAKYIGIAVGKLHSAGIVHGDLTTSNMILKEKQLFLIDFGLGFFSKKPEDMATDLTVFKEALRSVHFSVMERVWVGVCEEYKKEFSGAEKVFKALDSIEKRGRYINRAD